jgi:glycosyltransferase involved in cell wall biosynthesis
MIDTALSPKRPRLCFVGTMLGRKPGFVTSPGQVLADLFKARDYQVISTSAVVNRYLRLADIVITLLRHLRHIDILILDVFGGPSFVIEDAVSLLGRLFGRRVIMYLHGGAMPEFMARYPGWTKRVLGRADALITPSPFLARAVERYGFAARTIPNVIELSHYQYRHRATVRPRLFWMRSFHPIYNPLLAIRVLADLKAAWPDASLVMAGQNKGQELEARLLAQQLGVGESVRFCGFLDMPGKIREGQQADIFLNTSRVDNMPVALVEACAMGLPVVTTNVGGIPDLMSNGETGMLVPDEDDAAVVTAIKSLIAEPELAGRLSANGRRLAQNSACQNVLPQWEQLFSEVLDVPVGLRRSTV